MTDKGIQGIILAGGISSRMGYPKALMPIGNRFFLQAVYEQLAGAGARSVHVVVNAGLHKAFPKMMEHLPYARPVVNEEPSRGQIHSLELGLRAAAGAGAQCALVALVDLPEVKASTAQALVERAGLVPDRVLIPRYAGRNGHPILIPAMLFERFLNAGPEETGRDVIQGLGDQVEYLAVDDPNILRDIDSPADLGRGGQS